jgi:DNA-binding beta-propeller fold protein YncE
LFSSSPSTYYNRNQAPVYPTGITISRDNTTLYVANNLGDNLGILEDWKSTRKISKVSLRRKNSTQFLYPYDVELLPATEGGKLSRIYKPDGATDCRIFQSSVYRTTIRRA